MGEKHKVYVAVVQYPMAALDDDEGTRVEVFDTRDEADAWVDGILSEYEEGDVRDRMNWEVYEREVPA